VASTRSLPSVGGLVAIVLVVTALLAGSVAPPREERAPASLTATRAGWLERGAPTLAVPAALTVAGLSLRAGPVGVPLELRMPSLDVNAPVVGVGITAKDVMDAPMGPPDDPVWQQVFWYRGSASPGAPSTALIAGHVDGGGRPGAFAHIDDLRRGDPIVVHDTRSGLDIHFVVTETEAYTLDQAAEPAVLTRIYGAGPVSGAWPQPSADGLSHLTLITCAGTYTNGTHDHRLVVYATRIDAPVSSQRSSKG
jgi:sortase (surface protein transpeptidase)